MSDELQAQQLLDGLDRPRSPRPAFERALYDELMNPTPAADDDVDVVDLEPAPVADLGDRRRRNPARVLLAVAMVALLAVGTLVAVIQFGGGDDVATRSGGETQQAISRACTTFNEDAFGDVDRARLLGPDREQEFQDPVVARRLMTDLRDAIEALAADLRSAGINDPELTRLLGLAAANATSGLESIEEGAIGAPVANELDSVNANLLDAQRRLISLGVATCL